MFRIVEADLLAPDIKRFVIEAHGSPANARLVSSSWCASTRAASGFARHDGDGNTALAAHCGLDTHQCIIVSDADHLIATVGVNNLLIIQDGNVILVAERREKGKIKHLLALLRKKKLDKYL